MAYGRIDGAGRRRSSNTEAWGTCEFCVLFSFPFPLRPSACFLAELLHSNRIESWNGTKSATSDANVLFCMGKLVFTEPVSRPDYVRYFRPELLNIGFYFILRHNLAEHQGIHA